MHAIFGAIVLCLVVLPVTADADTGDTVTPISRSSPRDTYLSFLNTAERLTELFAEYETDKSRGRIEAMRGELTRLRRLMDLSTLRPSTRTKVGNAAVGYLYDIIARLPPIEPGSIPGTGTLLGTENTTSQPVSDSPLPESWTIPGTDIRIARMDDGPDSGKYLFTADSIASLPSYYREIRESPVLSPVLRGDFHKRQINATGPWISEDFVAAIPESLRKSRFDTPLWKILAITTILVLVFLVLFSWTWRIYRRSASLVTYRRILWRMTAPALILVLVESTVWFIAVQINPAGTFAASELILLTAIRFVATAWLVWLAIELAIEIIILSPRIPDASYDANLLRLAGRIIAYIIVGTILAFGADALGIPALGLAAGLGVGGVAVAFAAQPTLENLFAGVSLFADRPYRIGDWISVGGQVAEVERIGARASRLRNRDGTLCTVPNADMAKAQVVNYSQRKNCFINLTLAVKNDSSPEKIARLLENTRALFDANELIEKSDGWPRVYAVDVAPGQIKLALQARLLTDAYHVFLEEQEKIMLKILTDMRDLGIEMAPALPHMPVTTVR